MKGKNIMDIELNGKDRLRLQIDSNGPFVDVERSGEEIISIEMYSNIGIIEIRKKNKCFKIFQFTNNEWKYEYDYGFWKDAEIIATYDKGE